MNAHKDIDQDLRRRLNEQAPGSAAELEAIERGAGLFSLLAASFQGKQAWVTALLYGAGGLAFVGLLLCGNAYLAATSVADRLDWALGIIACLFLFLLVKIIGFAMLAKLELLRELRRAERRIILLEAALSKKS